MNMTKLDKIKKPADLFVAGLVRLIRLLSEINQGEANLEMLVGTLVKLAIEATEFSHSFYISRDKVFC
ncbi:MAG: hypothetical protein H0W77_08850 [Acidobacteria bacterium]|nr:hypothetical protein [Acidobacteriota bacterium]